MLVAATILVPLAALPFYTPLGFAQSGANANPNAGVAGDALQQAGRARAAEQSGQEVSPPVQGNPDQHLLLPGRSGAAMAVDSPVTPLANQPNVTPLTTLPGQNTAPLTVPGSVAGPPPQNAISVLLQQASFWHNQSQDGRALEALNRALELQPNNPQALALVAEIQVAQGKPAQAEAALAKLRAASPNDPHIAQIDLALRIGQINPTQLAEARRLAQEGRNAEAVQRYQQIFKGNPPTDNLAVEYYQVLAGTEGGWERARDGLAQIVRQNPSDLRAQLAYAQLLTYREGARSEGIARLSQLAQNPAVADQATRAWRQALGWLPVATGSVPPLTEFLQHHPNDPTVSRLLEAARNPPQGPPDVVGEGRQTAFHELNTGRLADAERGFQTALATNPNDADALGGLGLVRLRQGRTAEARSLLQRAIAADPSKRAQWQQALNGSDVQGEMASIRVAANRGDYAGAERRIRSMMGRGNNAGLQIMLADVQARSGDLAGAEATYRQALTGAPGNSSAMVGLAGVLQQEGRTAEATDLLTRAGATGSLRQIAQARAQQAAPAGCRGHRSCDQDRPFPRGHGR